jgi:hypothetical protein
MSTIRKVEERMRPTNRGSTMRKDSDEDYGGSDGDAASPAIGLERANIKRSSGDTPGVWDVERDKFPYAIVWTPIPCITWFLPFVGHMVRHAVFAAFISVLTPAVFVLRLRASRIRMVPSMTLPAHITLVTMTWRLVGPRGT